MALVGTYYKPPARLCSRCQQVRPYQAKGLCHVCYQRTRYPYQPTGTGRGGYGIGRTRRIIGDRLADFTGLRRDGLSIEAAAARLGVSSRTGYRYEARLKKTPTEGILR